MNDGWIHYYMDGWLVNGWMDGWMDGWRDGEREKEGRVDVLTDGWMMCEQWVNE